MNKFQSISTLAGIAVLLVFMAAPNSYASNHEVPPTLAAKQWGYTSITDSSWSERSTFLEPTAQGGISPNEDDMKIVAIWHYVIDETDPTYQTPFWKFGVYFGGTENDPTGALKVAETNEYYINRIDEVRNSGDGWQRTALPNPVDWPKNTPTWIHIRDYNGLLMTTWDGDNVPEDTTNNYNPIKKNKGMFMLPRETSSISNPLPDSIVEVSHHYGKAYAMYVEYSVDGVTQSVVPSPVMDFVVTDLTFDMSWTQGPHPVTGEYPTKYHVWWGPDNPINFANPETKVVEGLENLPGGTGGTAQHTTAHSHLHCFTIGADWANDGTLYSNTKCENPGSDNEPGMPSPPVLDYTVDGLRFDVTWTQTPDHMDNLPTHYLGEYYVTKDGVIVEETQDLEKPETGPFNISINQDGTQTGTYHHIHQHDGVFGHCFTITSVWEHHGEIRGATQCGNSIPSPDPNPDPVPGDTALEDRVTELEETIKLLEDELNEQQTRMTIVETAIYDIGIALTEVGSAFDYTFVQIEELKTEISSVLFS